MSPKINYPDKLFYKIGEVAKITGVEPYVLRYWESEFKFKLSKSKNKQRLYQKKDIETVQKIKRLLYDERYTIEGARKKIKERRKKSDNGNGSNNKKDIDIKQLSFDLKDPKSLEKLKKIKSEIELLLETVKS